MKAALGYFHADLFRVGLGLNLDDTIQNNGRAHVYIQKLNSNAHLAAYQTVLESSNEIEQCLETKQLPSDSTRLMRCLTKSTLDQPLKPCP